MSVFAVPSLAMVAGSAKGVKRCVSKTAVCSKPVKKCSKEAFRATQKEPQILDANLDAEETFTDKCSASSVSDACPTVSDDCPAAASAPCPADVPGPCLAAGPCADARRTSSELSECESDGEEWGFFDKLSLGARDSEPQFKAAPLPRASLSDGSYLSRLCGYRSAELDAITRLVRVELDVPCAIISIACDNWIWVASVATTLDRKTFLKSHWLPSNLALCTHAIDRANKHNDRVCQVVGDTRADPDMHLCPYVVEQPHIVFYAGVPLRANQVSAFTSAQHASRAGRQTARSRGQSRGRYPRRGRAARRSGAPRRATLVLCDESP